MASSRVDTPSPEICSSVQRPAEHIAHHRVDGTLDGTPPASRAGFGNGFLNEGELVHFVALAPLLARRQSRESPCRRIGRLGVRRVAPHPSRSPS
jgi:hypothetical protein